MNNIEVFQFPATGQPVRMVLRDGEPWFVGRDACDVLRISNPHSSLALLEDDERGIHTVETPSGQQELAVVSEAGLYSLILRSRRPEAKAFKRWVTHDILPTIRKTGAYGQRELTRLELIDLARDAELGRLAAVEAQQAAEQKVTALEPKAAYVDQFVGATGDACILRVFAGQLGIGEHALREYLIARKVIYRQAGQRWSASKQEWETDNSYFAYAQYKAWFKPGDQPEAPRRHNGQMRTTLYVTPAGKVGISRLLARHPLAIAAGENPT